MNILTWIIGLAISTWVGAMGVGVMLRTQSAKAWFGDTLKQSPAIMTLNGLGLSIAALIIVLNLAIPERVTSTTLKWALVGILIAQASTLFMQVRGGAPGAAMAGPIVLIILSAVYWFIKT